MRFDHGTTTLGFMYKGGVVLAVDSRATGGEFIGSQTMKKIVEINDFLLGMCISVFLKHYFSFLYLKQEH